MSTTNYKPCDAYELSRSRTTGDSEEYIIDRPINEAAVREAEDRGALKGEAISETIAPPVPSVVSLDRYDADLIQGHQLAAIAHAVVVSIEPHP